MARLTFDPRIEDATNAPLDVFSTLDAAVEVTAMSFPTPPLDTITVGSIDTEGDRIGQRRHKNRQGSLTIGVVEPPDATAVNYVSNPSFETATTGWAGNAGGETLTRTVTPAQAQAGDAYLHVAATASSNSGVFYSLSGLTAGATLTVSAYVRVVSATGAVYLRAITTSGPALTVASSATTSSSWQRLSVQITLPVGSTSMNVVITNNAAATVTFDLDAVQAVVGGATPYFDGDTPGCDWSGTPHASTSLRAAPGGARFRAMIGDLEAKAAKLASEGGTLRWINDDGDSYTLDVLAAEDYTVPYDIAYFAGRGAEVSLSLTALPYARGPEASVSLGVLQTGVPWRYFTLPGVAGDVPALGRLVVSDATSAAHRTLLWGLESKHVAGAALSTEAEGMTPGANVSVTADATASSGSKMRLSAPSNSGSLTPVVSIAGQPHHSTYRVIVRAQASSTNYTIAAQWLPDGVTAITNSAQSIPATGGWYLFDLGTIRVDGDDAPWVLRIVSNRIASTTLDIDYFVLIPCEEGSGQAASPGASASTIPVVFANGTTTITHNNATAYDPATSSTVRIPYEGDYLLIPPYGQERRATRMIVLLSRSDINGPQYGPDTTIDDFGVSMYVTPRYLSIR